MYVLLAVQKANQKIIIKLHLTKTVIGDNMNVSFCILIASAGGG